MADSEGPPEGELIPHESKARKQKRLMRKKEALRSSGRDQAEYFYTVLFGDRWMWHLQGHSWNDLCYWAIRNHIARYHQNNPDVMADLVEDLIQGQAPPPFHDVAELVEHLQDLDHIYKDEDACSAEGIFVCLVLADMRRKLIRFPRWLSPKFRARLGGQSDWEPESFEELFSAEMRAYHGKAFDGPSDFRSN
jgi:hypothetical protein